MAKRIENQCCDCAVPAYPCRGSLCPNRRVEVHYCDRCDPDCENPLADFYEVDGLELCDLCYDELYR